MKKNGYKEASIILLSIVGYFVIYNLMMFETMKQSETLNDAIAGALDISGITVNHVGLLLIIIISIAASVICLIDFVVYKAFRHIAGGNQISSSKILLATLISLLPGPLITYFILSSNLLPMNGIAIKVTNSVIHVFALSFLVCTDMEKRSRMKFVLLVVLYALISLLFSIVFRV